MNGSWFCASEFSGHDRRRLRKALRETHDLSLFRRIQAVLRVVPVGPAGRVPGANLLTTRFRADDGRARIRKDRIAEGVIGVKVAEDHRPGLGQ